MFKTFTTFFRAHSHDAAEGFINANTLTILRQQIRDAAVNVSRARKAVSVAMASQAQEKERFDKVTELITDLETRTMDALEANKSEIAREGAEAIASLEDERNASRKTLDRYQAEIERLKKQTLNAQNRLRELERGQRLAQATAATQNLSRNPSPEQLNSLKEAEETLRKLQERQQHEDYTRQAEAEFEAEETPEELTRRMASQGFGTPITTSTDSVLERLKARQSKATTTKPTKGTSQK